MKVTTADKISFTALIVSIICFIHTFRKDNSDEQNKYRVGIRDVYTDKIDRVLVKDFPGDTTWYSLVYKKLLITNEGTQPLSLISASYATKLNKIPFVLNSDTLLLYSLFFFSDTDQLRKADYTKVYDMKNLNHYFANDFNMRIEPGGAKEIYLGYLNNRQLAFNMQKKRKSEPNIHDEFSTELQLKFSNQLTARQKIYIERSLLENFGGGGSGW